MYSHSWPQTLTLSRASLTVSAFFHHPSRDSRCRICFALFHPSDSISKIAPWSSNTTGQTPKSPAAIRSNLVLYLPQAQIRPAQWFYLWRVVTWFAVEQKRDAPLSGSPSVLKSSLSLCLSVLPISIHCAFLFLHLQRSANSASSWLFYAVLLIYFEKSGCENRHRRYYKRAKTSFDVRNRGKD